ncbi:Gp37-like protein [Phycicoccus jejuensis]|uniref:Gp37-like protein n=1 Tax=Phycicoccus jejuensis TaxID=367299 RepID=UPI0004C30261|nr:siphovirus ReqiPepy6 Gp37-like family protein [Phycicoccus jejuensis]
MVTSWTLRGRSPARTEGTAFSDLDKLELVERCNKPDSLQITGPLGHLRSLLTPGGGCTLEDEDGVRFSGPLINFSKSGKGSGVATFASDLVWPWGRICYPTPGAAWEDQTADYDVRSGSAESVLLAFLNANAGPGALANRRVPGLILPASSGRGGARKITARFDNLGQLMHDIAESAGLRVTVTQDGTDLVVAVESSPDLSATAKYGTDEQGGPGSLGDGWDYTVQAPGATRALVGGGGEGAARILRERGDAAAEALWSQRIETFVDQRNTSDTAELDKAGDDELADKASPVDISVTVPDVPGRRLGRDVPLGALVGLDLDGDFVADRLRQVTTVVTKEGQDVSGVVGSPDAGLTRDQKQFLEQRKAIRKVQAR